MIEILKEKLSRQVQQSAMHIDQAVEAIEKALEKLLALREAQLQFANGFGSGTSDGAARSSVDGKIASLQELREELLAEKEQNLKLIQNLDSLLQGVGGYPYYEGGVTAICVFADPLVEQSSRFGEAAQRLSCNANHAGKKARGALGEATYMSEETEEILRCVNGYETAAGELGKLCHDASYALRQMHDAYAACQESAMASFDFFEDGCDRQAAAEQKQQVPPPPAQAACPPPPPPMQAPCAAAPAAPSRREDVKREAPVKQASKQDGKKGFLGLFKRQKKTGAASSDEGVAAPPQVDSVQFSAVAPNRVVPGKYLPINIVMYEDAFRKAVDDIIHAHGDDVKESRSGYQDVERNSWIRVVLTSADVVIEDGVAEQKWNGKYLDFEFAAKIPKDFAEEQILFSAAVYINDIIATKLKLILDCQRRPKRNVSVTREDIVSAFVSYASQDRNRVASIIQGMKKARPDMDIFFDIESLRSGQRWEDALRSEIENRDILFLCWSKYARESKWVDMEWRYALESKGEDCIEPIPIDSPDICPPPVELQQKHFNDKMLYIIKATAPAEEGRPCLIRAKTKECMTIDKPLVRIGRERGHVDLFIADNASISRNHASIIEREGKYYIMDADSVNHTYVDGERIPSNVETPIHFGAKIRLADEEFEFACH